MEMHGKKLVVVLGILLITIVPIFALSGEVISVSGKVEIESPSGWVALKEGDIVESGYVISTGFRSQAAIKVAGSLITLESLTRLTLEQLSEKDDSHNSEIFLDLGTIGADVQKAENKRVNFRVNTPVATASVRGTAFTMDSNTLTVLRGRVDLVAKINVKKTDAQVADDESTDDEDAQSVSAGNSSSVSSTGETTSPLSEKLNTAFGVTGSDNVGVGPTSASSSASSALNVKPNVGPAFADVTVTFDAN